MWATLDNWASQTCQTSAQPTGYVMSSQLISDQTAVSLTRDCVSLAARNVSTGQLTSQVPTTWVAVQGAVTMITTEMQLKTGQLFLAVVTIVAIINDGSE